MKKKKAYKSPLQVDLGNSNKRPGWVTIDIAKNPDIKHDLNNLPYPFEDDSVDFIEFRMTFDHLDIPLIDFIKEARRILKPKGGIHFETGNYFHWTKRLQFLFGVFELNSDFCIAHRRLLNYLYVVRMFKDNGFQVKPADNFWKLLMPSLLCQRIDLKCRKFEWFS